MIVKWGARRQILYYGVGGIVLAVFGLYAWQTFFTSTPTCFDRVQNNDETGVDCGGTCALLCANTAKAPTVLWARSFEIAPGTYTAAAYVQNNNVGAGAKALRYTFKFYDENNALVIDKEGTIDIPSVQKIPIVETNIQSGTRKIVRTLFEFSPAQAPKWEKAQEEVAKKLRIEGTTAFVDSRLSTRVVNDSQEEARNVSVIAVLFDAGGIARGASKSIVKRIARGSSETVFFSWPVELAGIVRAEVTVLPAL